MKYLYDLMVELLAAILILVLVGATLWVGLDAINSIIVVPTQQQQTSDEPKDLRPAIAQCDKELWDRIRGECR